MRDRLSSLSVIFLACMSLSAAEPHPQHGEGSDSLDTYDRRLKIQRELDSNQSAVTDLYKLLDQTQKSNVDAREYLESQIQRFDDRSAVLFDELDAIDLQRQQRERQKKVQQQVYRLSEEAKQLRRAGHVAPAAMREARVRMLSKALRDGTWKLFSEGQWREPNSVVDVIQLQRQVQELRQETQTLRQEITQLTTIVQQLHRRLTDQKSP